MEITSLHNAKVKQWVKYKEKKYREEYQQFLIEGEHMIQEAQRAGIIACILIEEQHENPFTKYPTYVVTKDVLRKLSESVSGTWIMAVCNFVKKNKKHVGNKVLVLDNIQDPGNVGTMIRSALSFGYDLVLLSHQSVDMYNSKLIRSTQGALFHIPIIQGDIVAMIQELKNRDVLIYATALRGAIPLQDVTKQTEAYALVFGNEGSGISQEVLFLSDYRIFIEMAHFESLNVAIAAAICMYEFQHRR